MTRQWTPGDVAIRSNFGYEQVSLFATRDEAVRR